MVIKFHYTSMTGKTYEADITTNPTLHSLISDRPEFKEVLANCLVNFIERNEDKHEIKTSH